MWTCSVDAAGAAIRKIVVGPSRLPLASRPREEGNYKIITVRDHSSDPSEKLKFVPWDGCEREREKSEWRERGEGANKAIRASERAVGYFGFLKLFYNISHLLRPFFLPSLSLRLLLGAF